MNNLRLNSFSSNLVPANDFSVVKVFVLHCGPPIFLLLSLLSISSWLSLTTGSPCTGRHAVDICVQAGPGDMAFTTPRWVSLCHPYPLLPYLTNQVLFISVYQDMPVYVCFGTHSVCVFKSCPDQPCSSPPVACVHSRGCGMQLDPFSAGCKETEHNTVDH